MGIGGDHGHRLAEAIELDLLPRLVREHGLSAMPAPRPRNPAEISAMAEVFAQLAVEDDLAVLASRFRDELRETRDLPFLFASVLAPAARLLGAWGEEGRISFELVDRGVKALERIVRMFNRETVPQAKRGWRSLSVFLCPMPGNQHTFGIRMAEELFQRAGWSIATLPSPTAQQIVAELARSYFHVAGLSVGPATSADDLRSMIVAVRAEALNPDLKIVVGGPPVVLGAIRPEECGADLAALDGAEAIEAISESLGR